MTVLALIELDGPADDRSPSDGSLRALNLARSLGGPVLAVAFGPVASPDALAGYGVSDLYQVPPGALDGYAPVAWARTLAALIADVGATAVVAASTDRGNEVMAHLGAITGLPMAANCVSVSGPADGPADGSADPSAGGFSLVRQRWAGLLLEDAALAAPVALLTVATDAVSAQPAEPLAHQPAGQPAGPPAGSVAVHEYKPELSAGDLAVHAVESVAGGGGVSLATARVVVGGGRGVGGPDGFKPLEELAELLGGVVGVSRVVTSEGWRPHRQQVGQTGTKITPELYLACGISGAIQHIAGCAGAKHIIAINTDPGAPIMSHAEYAVIGDLHQILPALVQAIRSR